MKTTDKILLESGTNELEVIEFQIEQRERDGSVYTGHYAVNIGKVREIINVNGNITEIPRSHPAVEGVINLRGRNIPVINLPKWFGKYDPDLPLKRIIVTEFNKMHNGFLVNSVARIHRVSWERVEPPVGFMEGAAGQCVTGVIKLDDRILMILDFEMITANVNPATGMGDSTGQIALSEQIGKTVLVAEDSAMIMNFVKNTITTAGYHVIAVTNGEDALNKLNEFADHAVTHNRKISDFVNIIISDIEMPKMDGLHLLTRIKGDPNLKELPVIIFSSMATEDNIKKWQGLGACDFISKPDMAILVNTVNKYIL